MSYFSGDGRKKGKRAASRPRTCSWRPRRRPCSRNRRRPRGWRPASADAAAPATRTFPHTCVRTRTWPSRRAAAASGTRLKLLQNCCWDIDLRLSTILTYSSGQWPSSAMFNSNSKNVHFRILLAIELSNILREQAGQNSTIVRHSYTYKV